MQIIIEFNGWITCDPTSVFFQAMRGGIKQRINGDEYIALPEDERSFDYILEDLPKRIITCNESCWDDITIEIED